MSYCAPGKGDHKTCFSYKQLRTIADEFNKKRARNSGEKIRITGTKYQLWERISRKLSTECNHEYCWIDRDFMKGCSDRDILKQTFRPKRPCGKYQWLTTSNIHDVMKQYEQKHPDFMFLGAVPINFCEVMNTICTLNLKSVYSRGITKIGIVFNTDPSHKPGKHWISMFTDLKNRSISFFDSYAVCPPPAEIRRLIQHFKSYSKELYGTENAFTVNCNNIRHQLANSECGVYSIYFLTESLKGRTFNDITSNIKRDEEINQFRHIYFSPDDSCHV